MKKLFTLLTLLVALVTSVWGADFVDRFPVFGTVTGSYAGVGLSRIALGTGAKTNNSIQASSNGSDLNFTVSVPSGFTIKSVVFDGDSNTNSVTCNDNPTTTLSGTITSTNTYTASADITSVTFTVGSKSSKATKLTNFVVTVTSNITDDYEMITPTGAASETVIPFTSSLDEGKLVSNLTTLTTGGKAGSSAANTITLSGNGAGVNIQTTRAIKEIVCVWNTRAPEADASFGGFEYTSATECGSAIGTYSYTTNKWTAPNANTKAVALKRCTGSNSLLSSIHIFYYPNAASYDITWANGGHGTAPTSPTSGSIITLPTMDPDGGYTNTGWKANQIVKVGDDDVDANTEIPVGSIVTLLQTTTFTGVWKAPSTFALTSDAEVEVTISGTSTITSENAAGMVTYESADPAIATVSSSGVITAVSGGKTTITVTDPGSTDVAGGSATVTVLVPYTASAADSYTLDNSQYAFSNSDKTKYYFTNGFIISNTAGKGYGSANMGTVGTGMKFSGNTEYVINTPSTVTVKYAILTARNNYGSGNSAANWGTVFDEDYSSETLPWSNEDPHEKEFVIASPSAGANLAFTPGGNQWQAIIKLYTIEYHAKYTVSFDKGEGTGTMAGTEVRGGSTYVLPVSTFIAPANKGFAGWLCDIDGLVYDAGENYMMTDANTTFTAQYAGVEGQMIIRATPTSTSAATVTGAVGGTADVNLQNGGSDGWKFGGDTHHIGITLASGWTFKAGDIINVHITKGQDTGGGIIFYNSDKSVIYDTGDAGVVGDNKYVLTDAFEGKTAIYLYRLTESNNWNAYIDYIEVSRPASLTSITPAYNKSTYVTTTALDFSVVEGLKAYRASAASAGKVTLDEVGAVPAGTPLMLIGTAGTEYKVPAFDSASPIGTNLFKAGDGTTTFDGTTYDYILYTDGLFYQIGSGAVPVGKAYLHCDSDPTAGTPAPYLTIDFGGETTDISEKLTVNSEKFATTPVYNLAGQRVAQPTKGLYIVNGKKVIIK